MDAGARSASAQGDHHLHLLPDLVLFEILPWLPTEAIWRLRSVSKLWHTIISENHGFAVKHWRRSTGDSSTMTISSLYANELLLVSTAASSDRRSSLAVSCRRPLGVAEDAKLSIKSTCHGLVLLLVRYDDEAQRNLWFYYLCNPLLFDRGSGERIPLCPWVTAGTLSKTALAFDPHVSTTHFKLVHPIQRRLQLGEHRRQRWGFSVFDSRTGKWAMTREEDDLILPVPFPSQVSVHAENGCYADGGVLYWNINHGDCLLSFDPWEEVAALVLPPDGIPPYYDHSYIGLQQDGRLTYIAVVGQSLRSWVMLKDDDNDDSRRRRPWARLLDVDMAGAIARHGRFFNGCPFTSYLRRRIGGTILQRILTEYLIFWPPFCSEDKFYLRFRRRVRQKPSKNDFFLCYDTREDRWTAFFDRCVGTDQMFYFRTSLFSPPKCKI